MMSACGPKTNYSIEGHLAANDFEGKQIYMYDVEQRLLDSAVVEKGEFRFEGWVEEPYFVQLVSQPTANGEQYGMRLIVERGAIYADLFADSLSGTELNDEYYQFPNDPEIARYRDAMQEWMVSYKTAEGAAEKARAERTYDSLARLWNGALLAKAERTLEAHSEDLLGAYAFCLIAGQTDPTTGRPTADVAALRRRMSTLSPVVANFAPTLQIVEQLEGMMRTNSGAHYADFEGVDLSSGERRKLSQYVEGKVAIVDFWASWCGPCRQEIKEYLKDLHERYAPKGVVVLGVDISDRPEKHREAVAELGITYPQLRCDDNGVAELYGINSIPHILLIAADGTIVARNLRGAAIEEALKKLL